MVIENELSVQFSHSVVSNSLWPHGLQHARLSCPSPTPRACSDSCPLSWWYHQTISSSLVPFSSRLQSFPASGSFQMSQFFTSSGENKRKLSAKKWMLLNCGVGKNSWESLGLQGESNSSILKKISPEYSLEWLMLKLKLQYFSHLMRRNDSLGKNLMLARLKAGGEGWWDGWMASPPQWTWVWASSGSWWWTGKPGVLQSMGSQRVRHDWATELNWTEVVVSKLARTEDQ